MEENLNAYRTFLSVCQYGSISKAAKELYISQPAISKSIMKLETALEVTLFTRNSRGVTLTPEGELLYSHVKSAFEQIHDAESQIRLMNQFGMKPLRIGVSTSLCKHVLLPYLNQYLLDNPMTRIVIDSQSSQQTLQMLEDDKIDVGLIGSTTVRSPFGFRKIRDIHDIFAAKPSYLEQLLHYPANAKSPYQNAVLLMLDQNNLTRQYIDSILPKEALVFSQLLEVTSMDLLIEFCKVGLGIGCLIQEFVTEELADGSLTQVPLSDEILPRQIGFVYKKGRGQTYANSMVRHFVELFFEQMQTSLL
ncbi:MAG: LysR family transcriptional regulator [Lachnospiraceae bacterium]